tara:strand:- start:1048 stop:1581 length:534 start_codon:yes stop_codon:yes gene_type:complete
LAIPQFKQLSILSLLIVTLLFTPTKIFAQDSATEIIHPPYKVLYHQNTSGISLEKATVTVQLFDETTDTPINKAKIKILVDSRTSDNKGWAHAIPLDDKSNIYVAELNLKSPGLWKTSLEIDYSGQTVPIDVNDILIRENESFSAGTIVFWGVAIVIVIGAFLIYLTAPNRKRRTSR